MIYIFNCFPLKENKVFLFSYYGSQYGCNPKYITEHILTHYPDDRFDVVWAFNDVASRSELKSIRQVKMMSLKYFYELCTSKIIITNYRTTESFVKRKQQYYIQTWHSSLRLKQIEKDAEDTLPSNYVEMARKDSLKCDLLLSGCKYSSDIFKRSFWYTGEIFEHGTPRNDLFFQNNLAKKKSIVEKLEIAADARILLYAPTFRSGNGLEVYDIDYPKLAEKLTYIFGGEWTILVRLHPHLLSKADQIVHGKNVMNVTAYDDVQELMLISDVLISDYSSLIFDFSMTNRPCFLYVPDLKEYTSIDRKLYFDVMDLPFIHATSNHDLLEKVAQFDAEAYEEKLTSFLNQIGSYEEGKASEYLLQRIDDVCFSKWEGDVHEAI